MNIEDVLSGELDIDSSGNKRWKYLDSFHTFRYMSLEQIENYFGEYLEEMENIIKDMEG